MLLSSVLFTFDSLPLSWLTESRNQTWANNGITDDKMEVAQDALDCDQNYF
jgi:hypothetical protein